MKPFNRSISCKHLLTQCSRDSEQTRFSAAASFVGGRAGLCVRFPLGGKCHFLSAGF